MIYKIDRNDIIDAMVNGAHVICWQFDGKFVLISSDIEMQAIESYNEEERQQLMRLDLWKQPCVGCIV